MKKVLLILLGMGIAQMSMATETTFNSNNTLSHTMSSHSITNISNAANYGSARSIYSTSSNAPIYSNEEISNAINSLSALSKPKSDHHSSQAAPQVTSERLDDMKKWAEQGNAEYQVKVGWRYYAGKGVRQDVVLARQMFQKAASQGDRQGQGMLGLFYEKGLGGLRQNRTTAKEWYGKVCDQGSQKGCDNYRRLNEQGY